MRRSVASVCSSVFFRTLKGKQLELSTPNFTHIPLAVARHRSKGQGHTVKKTVKNVTCMFLLVRALKEKRLGAGMFY